MSTTKEIQKAENLPVTILQPAKGLGALQLRDLWHYRELIYFMTWRNLKVRYKQTLLGASWAVLRPFLTMVVFSIFFGDLADVPSDGVPYPIFSFAALVPWGLFSDAVSVGGTFTGAEPTHDHQGLLPAGDPTAFIYFGWRGGFLDRLRGVDRNDVLLQDHTHC